MQGFDVADESLRASERCLPVDDSTTTTTTTTSNATPANRSSAETRVEVPSAKAQRPEVSPFTPRVALPLTPAMRHSPSRYARSESPASTASPRTPRWSGGSPLCSGSSPVVTFAPSTRFDQCRQRTNVAVRRSSDDFGIGTARPMPPALVYDGARRIAAFSLVGASLPPQKQQQQLCAVSRFSLAPAPIPPPPAHRFFFSSATADGAPRPADMTDSSSDDDFADLASTDSLSRIDGAEEQEGFEMAAAAAYSRPPPPLPIGERCSSSGSPSRSPTESSDDEDGSDGEGRLTGTGSCPSCAAVTAAGTADTATTLLHVATSCVDITPPPSPLSADMSGFLFAALDPQQDDRPRSASRAGGADVPLRSRPESGALLEVGQQVWGSATRGTSTRVQLPLECLTPSATSPLSITSAPLALGLGVLPQVLRVPLQLDLDSCGRGGSAGATSVAPSLPRAAPEGRVRQVVRVLPTELPPPAASPVETGEGSAGAAPALHSFACPCSCSVPLVDVSASPVTDVGGYTHGAVSASETLAETSANVSSAPAHLSVILNSQSPRAARASECAICPTEVTDEGGDDDGDSVREVCCRVPPTVVMGGAPPASWLGTAPLLLQPPHPRRMELLCDSPLDVAAVSPTELRPRLTNTAACAAGPTVARDVTPSPHRVLSLSPLRVVPAARLRSSTRAASAAPAGAAAADAVGKTPMGRNYLLVSIDSFIKDEHSRAVAAGRAANAAHNGDDYAVAEEGDAGDAEGEAGARRGAGEAAGVAPPLENMSPTMLLENARGDDSRRGDAETAIVRDALRRAKVPVLSLADAVPRGGTPGASQFPATPPVPHPPLTPSPAQAIRAVVECSPLPARSLPTPRSLIAANHCPSLRLNGEGIGAGHGLAADGAWCPLQLPEHSLATPRGSAAAAHISAVSSGTHNAASPTNGLAPLAAPAPTQTTASSVLSTSLPPITTGTRRSGPLSPLETAPLPPPRPPCASYSSSVSSALPLSASVPAVALVTGASPRTAATTESTTAAGAPVTARLQPDVDSETRLACPAPSNDRELSSLLVLLPLQPPAPPPLPSFTAGFTTPSSAPCGRRRPDLQSHNSTSLSPPPVRSRPAPQQQQQRRRRCRRRPVALGRSCASPPLPPPLCDAAPPTFQSLQLGASPPTPAVARDGHVVGDALIPLCPHDDGIKSFARRLQPSRRNSS